MERLLVSDNTWYETYDSIEKNHRRNLTTTDHKISDGILLKGKHLKYTVVNSLVVTTEN